jgi:hypothetical protein
MSTLMRTIVLSLLLLGVVGFDCQAAREPATPFNAIAKLAADLSQSDVSGAVGAFDSSMKGYGSIEQNIASLVAQTEILSAIDVVEDVEKDGVHKMVLDWYLTLTLQSDNTRTERRREQVNVEMRQIKGKWKITSMSPLTILDPVNVI